MTKNREENILKTALITGASRGIGKAIAMRLGEEGIEIIGTATTERGVQQINDGFKQAQIKGQGAILDVSLPESIDALKESLDEKQITPNILINNAGITRDNLLLRMKAEEWHDVITTNLNSIYYLSKAFLKGMLKARYGRVINISSVVALSGNPGQSNYTAAKAGMIGFTRSLAREVGARGITINAISPGFIETDMTDTLKSEQISLMQDQIPLRRLGRAEDIAGVAAFLVSPGAAYITGENINVSGGLYMG